ncbi:hypothetical protein MPF_0032 [Methanohalophilus portucalensis FDF-1]|uniref:Uncharacterized protein n=1 Tax=Methanohalophilus portucalensis FDF-1 TaxID=523843 RepID=A0A1L9C6Z2_9EURY|nr:hypothetical protein MPF_0032 [Methanohalophilus portucalensis FDF-1]
MNNNPIHIKIKSKVIYGFKYYAQNILCTIA